MTTVGYGEISPTNNPERLYAIFVMIFGATVFGYIIGSIAELSARTGAGDPTTNSLLVLRDYFDEQGVCQRAQSSVKRHYTFWYQEMTPSGTHESLLLSRLPPA